MDKQIDVKNVSKGGKEFTGTVKSTKMNQTVIVEVPQIFSHPLYKKTVKRNRRFAVHNTMTDLKVGDRVKIKETKPLSKTVHFSVLSIVTN